MAQAANTDGQGHTGSTLRVEGRARSPIQVVHHGTELQEALLYQCDHAFVALHNFSG